MGAKVCLVRGFVLALVVFVGAPAVLPLDADAAIVICQRKKKIRLREDTCKSTETQRDAAELGVVGPAGPQGNPGVPGDPGAPAVLKRTLLTYGGSATVTGNDLFQKVRDVGTFSKDFLDSTIRLFIQSHVVASGTSCTWQLRIDDLASNGSASLQLSETADGTEVVTNSTNRVPLVTMTDFDGLDTGMHTISLWVRGFTSIDCTDNQGNFTRAVRADEIEG